MEERIPICASSSDVPCKSGPSPTWPSISLSKPRALSPLLAQVLHGAVYRIKEGVYRACAPRMPCDDLMTW